MTQLTLPFYDEARLPVREDTEAAISRLVRELLVTETFLRMQAPTLDPADGNVFVRMDTVLGRTEINAQWSLDPEWLEHYNDIFSGYQCCDRMEDHEYVDKYVILELDVSAWHNGAEIGRANLGGVSLGWHRAHGGPDALHLAQTIRDLTAEALA